MLENRDLKDISNQINEIAIKMANEQSEIIENELKIICNQYNIPANKLKMEIHPDGVYKISIVLSEFQITNTFI